MFKNEEGFSLLELVVAVGVAGIIAAVALPTFAGLQDKASTTSATYAASASAAEALANSTIGNTGSNGSASTTGGASSSSSQAPSTYFALSAADFTGGNPSINQFDNSMHYTIADVSKIGQTSTDKWALITGGMDAYGYGDKVVVNGISQAAALALVQAVDNGATSISMMGYTWQLTALPVPVYNPTTGAYTAAYSKHFGAEQPMYGGDWRVVFNVTGVSYDNSYANPSYFATN